MSRDELLALASTLQSVGTRLFIDSNKEGGRVTRSHLIDASRVSNLQAQALRALAQETPDD